MSLEYIARFVGWDVYSSEPVYKARFFLVSPLGQSYANGKPCPPYTMTLRDSEAKAWADLPVSVEGVLASAKKRKQNRKRQLELIARIKAKLNDS